MTIAEASKNVLAKRRKCIDSLRVYMSYPLFVWVLGFSSFVPGAHLKCPYPVTSNIKVTGDYTKVGSTKYQINLDQYTTFSCVGSTSPLSPGSIVESRLEIKCGGSEPHLATSSAVGRASANWQSNDFCWFISECDLKCWASSPCATTRTQHYVVEKVSDIAVSISNCSQEWTQHCANESNIVVNITRDNPLGDGRFWGATTCASPRNTYNTSDASTWVVDVDTCNCALQIQYWERNSLGVVCGGEPAVSETIPLSNPLFCVEEKRGKTALIVCLVLLGLVVLGLGLTWLFGVNVRQITRWRTRNQERLERMTAMDRDKFQEVMEEASRLEVDDIASRSRNQSAVELEGIRSRNRSRDMGEVVEEEDSPIYDEVPDNFEVLLDEDIVKLDY